MRLQSFDMSTRIRANPTISVLLPVHNAEPYLHLALDSVLGQTFEDFELVAIDDGSTDESPTILRRYESEDTRIRILFRERRGVVSTLNELIAASRANYLARMDADDVCRPQRFQRQIDYLKSHPTCVAVGSRVLLIDPEGMPICEFISEFAHEQIDGAHISNSGHSRICHPSVMMRREAVLRVGGYRADAAHAEDIDLFIRLAEIGQLANLQDVLLEYRRHADAIGYAFGEHQMKARLEIVKSARERRGMMRCDELNDLVSKMETGADMHRTWGWWALSAGNLATARKHAFRAMLKNPLSLENAKLLACAIRGF